MNITQTEAQFIKKGDHVRFGRQGKYYTVTAASDAMRDGTCSGCYFETDEGLDENWDRFSVLNIVPNAIS